MGNLTDLRVSYPPRGRGPALLLLAPAMSPALRQRAALWAEEGYVVLPAEADSDAKVKSALERLAQDPARLGKIGGMLVDCGRSTIAVLIGSSQIAAVVCYDTQIDPSQAPLLNCPAVLHFGAGTRDQQGEITKLRETAASRSDIEIYRYGDAEPGFSTLGSPSWNQYQAGIAHSRSIAMLRRELGPHYNLGDLWDRHLECEFVLKDATANMKTMVAEPYVNHVPTMTGGVGHDQLKRFYTHHFIHQTPPDRFTIPISRTIGADRVVEEKIFCFTHTTEIDWLLPGVKPTGKYVEVPLVVVVSFRGDKLYNEHIYWDQASLLVQLGLIDPTDLPICGIEQARKLRTRALPSNTLMSNWKSSEGKPC